MFWFVARHDTSQCSDVPRWYGPGTFGGMGWDGNVCGETNSSHLKIDDWKTTFFWNDLFVSFPEGIVRKKKKSRQKGDKRDDSNIVYHETNGCRFRESSCILDTNLCI